MVGEAPEEGCLECLAEACLRLDRGGSAKGAVKKLSWAEIVPGLF